MADLVPVLREFLLAAATILYSVFCPQEVKRYSSAFEMADAEAKHHLAMNESSLVQHKTRETYLAIPTWMMSYRDLERLGEVINADLAANNDELAKKLRQLVETVTIMPTPAGEIPGIIVKGELGSILGLSPIGGTNGAG